MRQKFPLRTTPAVNLRFNIEGLTNGPDVVGGLFSPANRCLDGG